MAFEEQTLEGTRPDERIVQVVGGGQAGKALGGVVGVILSILGIANVYPGITLPIAIIAVGVALLFEGAAAAALHTPLVPPEARHEGMEAVGGISSIFFGGAVGIVLGILALIGISPLTLTSVSAIVYGGTLVLGGAVPSRLGWTGHAPGGELSTAFQRATDTTTGTQVLVGIGSVVLGILGLVWVGPTYTLILVAMLALGFAVFVSGAAVGSRVMQIFSH